MALTVAELRAVFSANTKPFMAGLAKMKASEKTLRDLGHSWSKFVSLPVAAAGAASIKMAADFQSAMTRVHTQAGASTRDVQVLSKQVLGLSRTAQQGPQDLADALYHLKSVGLSNVQAMKALKQTSDLAAVGNSDLEQTVNAVAGAWRSGIEGARNFHHAVATLNAIVGAGNMKMQDLVGAMGTGLMAAGRTFGLSMKDVGAALATLTDEGQGAQQAATRLRMSFSLLGAPSKAAEKYLEGIGLSGLKIAQAMRQPHGLLNALTLVKQHIADLSKAKQAQILSHIFGGGQTSATIMTLLNNLNVVKQKEQQITHTTGRFDKAVVAQRKTFEAQWGRMKSSIETTAIVIGKDLMPVAQKVVRWVGSLANRFSKLNPTARHWVVILGLMAAAVGPALLGLATMIKSFTVVTGAIRTATRVLGLNTAATALSKSTLGTWLGVKALEAAAWVKGAARTVASTAALVANRVATVAVTGASKAWAAAQWLLNAALDANPIGLVITLVAALAAGIVLAWKHSKTFRDVVKATWHGICDAAQWAWNKILKPVLHLLISTWLDVVGVLVHGAAKMFGWVPGVGGKLKHAAAEFDKFKGRVNRSLGGIHNKTVHVGIAVAGSEGGSYTNAWHPKGGGSGGKYAAGGPVSGPGGPTSDSISARLSNGEYVVNAAAASKHRALLDSINYGSFASGGLVDVNATGFKAAGRRLPYIRQMIVDARDAAAKQLADTWMPAPPAGGGGPFSGGVTRWAPLILQVLRMFGLSPSWLAPGEHRMMVESGGNPTVVNKWDSNWAAGHPSVGLMQVIRGTFDEYAGPYRNVGPFEYGVSVNPLANIYAGVNYALHRYGVPFVGGTAGYDSGGWLMPGIRPWNHTGKPEAVLTPEQSQAFVQLAQRLTDGDGLGGGDINVQVIAPSSSPQDVARSTALALRMAT